MPKRKPFEENWVYHIYNRGLEKQKLFFNKYDYEKFFRNLEKFLNDFKNIKLLSYCVLPNHFHFIIQNKEEWFDLSNFMRQIQSSYAKYLVEKYKGSFWKWQIFEWRFNSKQITSEKYFNKCLYYVNYNAIKHWIVDKIEDYPYSSLFQLDPGVQQNKTTPGSVRVNFSLENWLQEFIENFEDFEF